MRKTTTPGATVPDSDIFAVLRSPAPALTLEAAMEHAVEAWGIEADARMLVSERDQNFLLEQDDGTRYLLKVSNEAEAAETIEFENAALDHVRSTADDVPVPEVIRSLAGEATASIEGLTSRVMSWLPGVVLQEIEPSAGLRRQLGVSLAQLGRALRGFFHPAAGRALLWDIQNASALRELLAYVDDAGLRRTCSTFLDDYADRIAPRLDRLRGQVIYSDLNPGNVLVSAEQQPRVSGIVDFGDMVYAPLVCDVAIAAAYQLTHGDDPLAGVRDVLSGYDEITPLETEEWDVIGELIQARLATTIVVSSWRAAEHPENRDYILGDSSKSRARFEYLAALSRDDLRRRCFAPGTTIVRRQPSTTTASTVDDNLMTRRTQLGSAYRLFYDRPVHLTRGRGAWLYDSEGRAFLDAYNNVPLVGHCHPRVVDALSIQAATLNTHTRYLHTGVLDYADRLLSLFPTRLDRVMFSCTGTEANELAIRMARANTGNEGVLVSHNAYHGNSTTIAWLSPANQTPERRPDWIETFPPPDVYRAPPGLSEDAVVAHYLAEIDAAIGRLEKRGIQPAALVMDSAFTSDGVHIPLKGYISGAAKRIRAAGGLFVADEVQSGFGRLGRVLWGFELDDDVPDVVTLGKPIGNGHPMAATIASQSVVDGFAANGRYFNTFGGNPVSAAVGLAVLDVFEDDKLQDNSRQVGGYLQERLQELGRQFSVIGNVRGSGLLAGVELVEDVATGAPDSRAANNVVNAMRDRGVLISSDGPHDNVLKIRPPLLFARENVDLLVETLEQILAEH